jgi:arylsulfatase
MNTPFRWAKQFASMLGGIRNGMIVAWNGHIAHPNTVCAEFGHVVDIAPTMLDAAHVPAPDTVSGIKQKPFDGQSLLVSFAQCAPDKPRTQYFEMTGKKGLYKDGWFASNDDGRLPWQMMVPTDGPNPPRPWQLYDLNTDFAQSDDVAAKHPDRLKAMIAIWNDAAVNNNVFPLNHSPAAGRGLVPSNRKRFDLWGKDVSLPAKADGPFAKDPFASSLVIDADIDLDRNQASGVVVAVGSRFGGWSLYLDRGRPTFVYATSTKPDETYTFASRERLPKGAAKLRLNLTLAGAGNGADVQILNGESVIASGHIAKTFIGPAGSGENLDAGRDTGVPVTDYPTPHGRFEGDIRHVAITVN